MVVGGLVLAPVLEQGLAPVLELEQGLAWRRHPLES
jgi:hypothetical protein